MEDQRLTAQIKPLSQKTGWESILRLSLTTTLLAGLWWLLTNGAMQSWLVGLPFIACAVWTHRLLSKAQEPRISPIGLLLFVPYFLWESLRGGTDVALRTLAPRLRIQPDFRRYRTGLKTLTARTFFANCVSLLPGTLAADLQDEWLEVHVLNTGSDFHRELTRLENVVARLFSENGVIQ